MSEKTVYLEEMNHLTVVCYERPGYDSTRVKIWVYEVVVKGQSRACHLIHYILARNIYESYTQKRPHEVVKVIQHAIREARVCIGSLVQKVQNDSKLLKDVYDLIKTDDITHG